MPGELVQVFSNLIANAIDATPLGGASRREDPRNWREGITIFSVCA